MVDGVIATATILEKNVKIPKKLVLSLSDESLTLKRIVIKKKCELLNYKCSRKTFSFAKHLFGWTEKKENFIY